MDDQTRREIEWECEKLSIAYARYVDYKEYDKFVQLFAPDGVLTLTGKPIVGHEKLIKSFDYRPDSLRSRHVLTNIYTHASDENHAEGISYLTLYRHPGEDIEGNDSGPRDITGPSAIGHYADKFIKTEDGWRFASRSLHFAFVVKN